MKMLQGPPLVQETVMASYWVPMPGQAALSPLFFMQVFPCSQAWIFCWSTPTIQVVTVLLVILYLILA